MGEIRVFKVKAGRDELGEPEMLTFDLSPVIDDRETLHLDTNGLPRVNTLLEPGMILVGKIGQTIAHATEREPNSYELHALSFKELNEQFGHLWRSTSEYVPAGVFGIVEHTECIADPDGTQTAVVHVRLQP